MVNPHIILCLLIRFQLTKIPKNIRIAIGRKMGKKHDIVIILKLITKSQRTHFFELVLLIIDIPWVKSHISCFTTCPDCLIIIVVLNIKALSVPLDTITLVVPLAGVDKWLHAHTVERIIFHKVHHV